MRKLKSSILADTLSQYKNSKLTATSRLRSDYLQIEAGSYKEIFLSLGLDDSKSVLFATDNLKEAEAAEKSGWSVVLADRPGNAALPSDAASKFRVVKTMDDLLHF